MKTCPEERPEKRTNSWDQRLSSSYWRVSELVLNLKERSCGKKLVCEDATSWKMGISWEEGLSSFTKVELTVTMLQRELKQEKLKLVYQDETTWKMGIFLRGLENSIRIRFVLENSRVWKQEKCFKTGIVFSFCEKLY